MALKEVRHALDATSPGNHELFTLALINIFSSRDL